MIATRFVCPTCGVCADQAGTCDRDRSELEVAEDALLGSQVAGYRLTHVIGRGGTGTVYRAVHPSIGAAVAVKVLVAELAEDRESVERFIAEAKTANLVHHEGLVKVIGLGVLPDGRPYQVMEHLTGVPLSRAIRGRLSLPLGSLCARLAEALRAISVLHARGIVHRDLKPSNLFVTTAGFIKVLDFGIAKLASSATRLTRSGHLIGTPGYMAPEQAEGREIDARSDIYSMGVVLYECLAGVRPFQGRVVEAMAKRELPPVLEDAPPGLAMIIRTAMGYEPRDRFADAMAMACALVLVAADLPKDAFGPLVRDDAKSVHPLFEDDTVRMTLGPAEPVTKIGRYAVRSTLGSGASGMVVRAVDPAIGREVAIKLVRATSPACRDQLVAEARAIARVHHPNVVTLFELGEDGDQRFLAMEYVDAIDLDRWLRAKPRTWQSIVARFVEAGRGLAAAHAAGVVHRDFKPANVLVTTEGRAKVCDFGIARAHGATQVRQGTTGYMAPEQLEDGEVDPRADQFAFCAALWHALHGELPYSDPDQPAVAAALAAHRGELRAPRNGAIPASLHAALSRGLAASPAARFDSMTALLAELSVRPRRRARILGAAGLAAVATAACVWLAPPPVVAEPPAVPPIAHAASGSSTAIVTRGGVWVERNDGVAPRQLPSPIEALAIDDRAGVVRAAVGMTVVEVPLAGGVWRPAENCRLVEDGAPTIRCEAPTARDECDQ